MNKFLRILGILFILALFVNLSHSANAQSIRKVLMEEGTNASCGPCASQNPIFEKWLDNHLDRVVPIVYHASWPGPNDPMYTYDKNMNTTRIVTYYAINGVPAGKMNGQDAPTSGSYYAGAPGDTVALSNFLKKQPGYSPITLTLKFTNNNGTGKVTVDVKSLCKLTSNFKLRIAICEEHHHYDAAGSNGEKEFYFLARAMMPDAAGTVLSQEANETKSYSFDYSVDTSFASGLYAVAFVQNDATKEVLQAETTMETPAVTEPDYALMLTTFNMVFVGGKDESNSVDIILKNNSKNDVTYLMNATKSSDTPNDWKVEVINNKYVVPVKAGGTESVTVKFTIGQTTGVGAVVLSAQLTGISQSFQLDNMVGISNSIKSFYVLGGAATHSVLPIIKSKRGTNDIYSISPTTMNFALPQLNQLKSIIWDGSTDGAISTDDATMIKQAMGSGVGVMMCGGNITSGAVNNGVLTLMNATYNRHSYEGYGSSPWPVSLAGIHNDIITGDFGDSVQGHLINWLLPTFKISNKTTTFPIMSFTKSQDTIFAIRAFLPEKGRAAFLGINPFVILDEDIRSKLVNRTLDWVEGLINDVPEPAPVSANLSVYPNPAKDYSNISLTITGISRNVRLSLFNSLGNEVKLIQAGVMTPDEYNIPFNTAGLSSGNYQLVLNIDGRSSSLPFVVVK